MEGGRYGGREGGTEGGAQAMPGNQLMEYCFNYFTLLVTCIHLLAFCSFTLYYRAN